MPSNVGPYRLIERIGEGGMGVVYLAISPGDGLVAVKTLRPYLVGGDDGRARFAREVATMRLVRGAQVAEVLDADVRADPPYIVTRYVRGPSLAKVINDHGPLREHALASFALGLAGALVPVHRAGLVHRDVKPGNVLLADNGPVLIDFGLARATDGTRLTAAGLVAGTPSYLAPETVLGRSPTTATDIHGWAATVVYAASGASPFGAGPDVAVMDRIRRGAVDLERVPAGWRGLLSWALSVDPQERPDLPEVLRELGSDLGHDLMGDVDADLAYGIAAGAGSAEPPTQVFPVGPDAGVEPPTHVLPAVPPDDTEPPTQVISARTTEDAEPATQVFSAMPPTGSGHHAVEAASGAPTEFVPAPPPPPAETSTASQWQPTPDGSETSEEPLERSSDLSARLPGLLTPVLVGVLIVVLFGLAPYVALGVVAVLVAVLRALGRVERRVIRRRSTRGITRGEAWVIGAATPWDLLLSVPKAVVHVALAGLSAGLAASVVALTDAGGLRTPVLVAGGVVAALVWWGPGAGEIRRGARIVRVPLSRDPRNGWVAVGILAALTMITVLSWDSYGLSWFPAENAPWVGW